FHSSGKANSSRFSATTTFCNLTSFSASCFSSLAPSSEFAGLSALGASFLGWSAVAGGVVSGESCRVAPLKGSVPAMKNMVVTSKVTTRRRVRSVSISFMVSPRSGQLFLDDREHRSRPLRGELFHLFRGGGGVVGIGRRCIGAFRGRRIGRIGGGSGRRARGRVFVEHPQ